MKYPIRAAGPLACLLMVTGVWAHQPTPVDVELQSRVARRGESYLRLANNTRESQTLAVAPGVAGTAMFRPQREIVLSPGAVLEVNLGDLGLNDGVEVLHVSSTVTMAGGGTAPGPELYEVLQVDRTGVVKSSYEEAFLSRRRLIEGRSEPMRVDLGGGYIESVLIGRMAFASEAVSGGTPVERVDEVSPVELANLPLRWLPEDGGAEGMTQTRTARMAPQQRDGGGVFGGIKGIFTVKIPGASAGTSVYQAAWGWRVHVWQFFGSKWMPLGSAVVTADGSWSADYLFPPMPGVPVRVEYQPANRFLRIQDADGDIYTWGDDWTVEGAVTDIGFRSANLTKTGSAPGIDRIYQGGMALWRKFKKYNMSALRDKPIEITYPNTKATGKCQTPSGSKMIAWSCSQSGDGKIWMIPLHAVAGVTQHELAHSIHSYYWDGNMPSGSGIPHNITNCYNGGLALSEGFANFIPYWVQFERTENDPSESWFGIPIDTPGSGYCNGSSNEMRVAATFWDVYDTVADGTSPIADTWHFQKAWAPVSTFLKNPGHNSMYEYMSVYVDILGPTSASGVAATFILNTTQLP